MSLTESTRIYYYFKYYAEKISEYCNNKEFLSIDIYENIKKFLKNSTIVLSQYKIILNTCPIEEVFGSDIPILPFVDADVTFKNSQDWCKANDIINNTITIVKKLNTTLLKSRNHVPCTEFELITPEFVGIADLSNIKTDLSIIQRSILDLKDILCVSISTGSLILLETETKSVLSQLDNDIDQDVASSDNIGKKVEKLTENIMVVIQNLYKKYTKLPETKEIAEENEDQLQDDHLKKLLVENLSDDMMTLGMNKILKKTERLSSIIFKTSPKCQKVKDIVNKCVPFLEQIANLYQYFITQQVSSYRVTSKMSSILLNIFIELASKVSGFKC